ncbi:MAG: hypothetical protein JWO77_3573 [Ilumatobacteraceae bacterium]|nr:hypothetical protein [Ilumatobacteraceae bacterium]
MDLKARQDTYNGFGDTLARAFELVVTPLLFALVGHVVDRALGVRLAFALGLGALAVIGQFLRAYFVYAATMDAEQARVLKRGQA